MEEVSQSSTFMTLKLLKMKASCFKNDLHSGFVKDKGVVVPLAQPQVVYLGRNITEAQPCSFPGTLSVDTVLTCSITFGVHSGYLGWCRSSV